MLVSEYMSESPVTIGVEDDYSAAFEIMDQQGLHHLPVINSGGDVVGILTRRDLQLAARYFHEMSAEVAEVMHAPVVTIAPDANLITAAERMTEERIGCLPVVEGGRLIGVITETDLFRALKSLLAERAA